MFSLYIRLENSLKQMFDNEDGNVLCLGGNIKSLLDNGKISQISASFERISRHKSTRKALLAQ
jgi:hypothetical protein